MDVSKLSIEQIQKIVEAQNLHHQQRDPVELALETFPDYNLEDLSQIIAILRRGQQENSEATP